MQKIKKMTAAGTFYPADKNELAKMFKDFENKYDDYQTRAVIIPHAGYTYSGKTAMNALCHLNKNTKNIFIMSPAHYEKIFGCVLCSYDEFETPLGNLKVNTNLCKEFAGICECMINNYAFENEYGIEVQLPFIKKLFPKSEIVPILYGCENFKYLKRAIENFRKNQENSFIISSDLSHFYPAKQAEKTDLYTAKMIENNETLNFDVELACGAVGICAMLDFCKDNGYSFIRTGLTNSSQSTGNSSRVVGYGSWFLYEGDKNQYIKEYHSDTVKEICKNSIMSGLHLGTPESVNSPCVFEQNGISFVTINLSGKPHGRKGTTVPQKTLSEDLKQNAHDAAFNDKNFPPLSLSEFKNISISVSLLSKPKKILFSDEKELLENITPYKDGIIIRDGKYQAVFLPEIWEKYPDTKTFLEELKQTSGLEKTYLSESFEAFKFNTVEIQ